MGEDDDVDVGHVEEYEQGVKNPAYSGREEVSPLLKRPPLCTDVSISGSTPLSVSKRSSSRRGLTQRITSTFCEKMQIVRPLLSTYEPRLTGEYRCRGAYPGPSTQDCYDVSEGSG